MLQTHNSNYSNGHYRPKPKVVEYNYQNLELKDWLRVLPGKKEKDIYAERRGENTYKCFCPLSHNHKIGYDVKPSLLVTEKSLAQVQQEQEKLNRNPDKKGMIAQRVVVHCRSHGGRSYGQFDDGKCTTKELMRWFHRQFLNSTDIESKMKMTPLQHEAREEYRRTGKGNFVSKPLAKEHEKYTFQHDLYSLELADELFEEYENVIGALGWCKMMLSLGVDHLEICKDLDDWMKSHQIRLQKKKIDQLQRKIILSKDKAQLVEDYMTARDNLAQYHDAVDGTYPFNTPSFQLDPEDVRNKYGQ